MLVKHFLRFDFVQLIVRPVLMHVPNWYNYDINPTLFEPKSLKCDETKKNLKDKLNFLKKGQRDTHTMMVD